MKKLLGVMSALLLVLGLSGCSKIKDYKNEVTKEEFVVEYEKKIGAYSNLNYTYTSESKTETDSEIIENDKVTKLTEEYSNESKSVSVDLVNKIMNEIITGKANTKEKSDSGTTKDERVTDINITYQKSGALFYALDNKTMTKSISSQAILVTKYALGTNSSSFITGTSFYIDDNVYTIVTDDKSDSENNIQATTQFIFKDNEVTVYTEAETLLSVSIFGHKERGKQKYSSIEVYSFSDAKLEPKNIDDYK